MRTSPLSPPAHAFLCNREVSFSDTDAAGFTHFTALMRYVEDAEHKALRSEGLSVFGCEGGWPRVHVEADFFTPLRFGDKVQIRLWVTRLGTSSLTWMFQMLNEYTGSSCASGKIVSVRIDPQGHKIPLSPQEKQTLKKAFYAPE